MILDSRREVVDRAVVQRAARPVGRRGEID